MSHEGRDLREDGFVITSYSIHYTKLYEYMPELMQPWGYPAVLLVMLAMAIGMFAFFRRKKWL